MTPQDHFNYFNIGILRIKLFYGSAGKGMEVKKKLSFCNRTLAVSS